MCSYVQIECRAERKNRIILLHSLFFTFNYKILRFHLCCIQNICTQFFWKAQFIDSVHKKERTNKQTDKKEKQFSSVRRSCVETKYETKVYRNEFLRAYVRIVHANLHPLSCIMCEVFSCVNWSLFHVLAKVFRGRRTRQKKSRQKQLKFIQQSVCVRHR